MFRRFLDEFSRYSTSVKVALVAVLAIWALIIVTLVAGAVLLLERPGQAQQPTPGSIPTTISLDPVSGPAGTTVTVQGEGWQQGQVVLIYLIPPRETEPPNFATAGSTTNNEGRFIAKFVIPSEPEWQVTGMATVLAHVAMDGASAQAAFQVTQPALSAIPTSTPTELPTVTPMSTPTLTATPEPTVPTATAVTDLNIRTGAGTEFPVVGVLRSGQGAEITGISPDRGWWQIRFAGVPDDRGWVSARYVRAENTQNVPIVQPPARPPTATPTPTPSPTLVVIHDWRGEYFDNRTLSGSPVLVRNDGAVNFSWGSSSPASVLPVDNFSTRWTRDLSFPVGNYRFFVRADDGVRLWIDGTLIIDEWHDASATLYAANFSLSAGVHNLRVEYYEHLGDALIQLTWEQVENYPDWKGEYFDNRDLRGDPILVRNDPEINFDWGSGSPAPSIPVDNFSVRWTRQRHFEAGTYRFSGQVDDGVRLWIDGKLVIDEWHDAAPTTYSADVNLTEGTHTLRMEYYEHALGALARLSWDRVENYPDWKAEYFDNRELQGDPVLVRNEAQIDYNWGRGSPSSAVSSDNFSARWTRKVDLEEGTYLFRVRVDDGVRLWVDGRLVIDDWSSGSARVIRAEQHLEEGEHRFRLEYFERGGEALIELDWERQQPPANQPPVANAGDPYQVDEGSIVRLDGDRSGDPDGAITQYEWDFNYHGGFTIDATGRTVETSYPDGPADVTIALRVTDDDGATNLATAKVKVLNVAPTVEGGGPYTGVAGRPITMAGSATDPSGQDQASLAYTWDFGDGTQGSGAQVSHTYAKSGRYTATLTVSDKDGGRSSDTAQVQVSAANQPPTAAIDAPPQGVVGEPLTFDASRSSDTDGQIVSYAWQFGDGATGNGVQVPHTYDRPGTYTVRLTVTDNGGLTDQATHNILIEPQAPANQPPTADIQAPDQAQAGQAVQFDASGSGDPDGRIVSYGWDFDDGATGSGVQVAHTFEAGKYVVTLTVTDDGGLSDQASHPILVKPQPVPNQPVPAISGPMRAPVGQALSFSGRGSYDPDGQIVSYEWNFGDGTTASGVEVMHTYGEPGKYLVRLRVTDDSGLNAATQHTLRVEQASQSNQPPRAVITAPTAVSVNQLVQFDASSSSDPDGQITQYDWNLGDSTTANGVTATHVYTQPGVYQVTLTVTDNGGYNDVAAQIVDVQPAPQGSIFQPSSLPTNNRTIVNKGEAKYE